MSTPLPAAPDRPESHDDHGQEPAICARDVVVRFDEQEVLTGLSLDVAHGSIYGFVGPSGAGKTTGIRVLTGALRPSQGEVRVLGAPPSTFGPAERARIGYMPQLSVLFPQLSLQRNLNFVASIYGLPLRRRQRLRGLLEFLDLDEHRRTPLERASGGMQRRLALAAALVHNPTVLFLDEPTTGMDPMLRHRLWGHFAELAEQGRTLFITTQYVSETAYCDRVALLDAGRVAAEDAPAGLRRRAFGGDMLRLRLGDEPDHETLEQLRRHELVVEARRDGDDPATVILTALDGSRALVELPDWLSHRGATVSSAEPVHPPFDDVFVALLDHGEGDGP